MFGEPDILKGYGRRNTTLNALAPTTSSAFILGQVSQSIEPLMSNYYIKDLAKAKAEIKNKFLEAVLCYYEMNTKEVWLDIAKHDGSVQHLDFLTDHEREVFLTFSEINPYAVIEQAAIRQEFLDQTQSLNLMLPTSTTPKELNKLVIHAWELGICTLYYHHSTNAAQQFLQKSCVTCEA
jgi:ribonucleoside-diphosphate reductase alpha chain